jgi:hypothetical protein
MPVGRVKARNPDGHSGQRRLHDVVGSMLMLMGMARMGTASRDRRDR